MKIIKLDSSDVEALDKISKTKGTTRYVYPPFGVSQHVIDRPAESVLTLLQVKLGFPDKEDD
jgi:glycerol 2-dehydrogenase (NADP+)